LPAWWSAWSFLFRVHSHPLYRHRDNNHDIVTVTIMEGVTYEP
jgi:hypothetical protein